MTAVLSALWTITRGAWLTAGVLILARLVFHRVLSSKAKYYLWLLLALRLLLPVLPESPVSLMNLLPERPVQRQVLEAPMEGTLPQSDPVWLEADPEAAVAPQAGPQAQGGTVMPAKADEAVSEVPTAAPKRSLETILFWVWISGLGAVLLVQVCLYWLTARQLRKLPYCGDSDTLRVYLGLKKALHIKNGPRLVSGGAGMLGRLLRPTIVLPVERHGEDAAPILLHELIHYKYGDLWISALFRLLCAVHWFNPVVWLCFRWAIHDSEAACDQRVLETKLVGPERYAATLYEEGMLKKGLLFQTAFGGRRHSLKRRILGIANFRSPKLYLTLLAVILALTVTACTLTDAHTDSETLPAEGNSESSAETAQADFEAYMQGLEPPNGIYGLTLEEHIDKGLMKIEDGELEHYTREDCDLTYSVFTIYDELGGEAVEIAYNFSQTMFSKEEILTQVFVTPPADVPMGTWLSNLSDPWLSGMTQNTDLNGFEWNTAEYVGDFLTEQQLDAAAKAETALAASSDSSEFHSSEQDAKDFMNVKWRVVSAFASDGVWQFNGTGAALIRKAQETAVSPWLLEDSTVSAAPTLTATISPYVLSGDSLTYENTNGNMSVSDVIHAQSISGDAWEYTSDGQPILHGNAPLADAPEVTDICYRFGFDMSSFSMELFRVETHYDPDRISYDALVAQRTEELGEPDEYHEKGAHWSFGDVQLDIYPDRDGRHQEWLCIGYMHYDTGLLPDGDMESYIADIQPTIGHYGWTFEEHVAAGLLDPDKGTLENLTENGVNYQLFTTTVELAGETLDAKFCFVETMAGIGSGHMILSEINVTPPEGVTQSQWAAAIAQESWNNRMLHNQTAWESPIAVGYLLTDAQREVIGENMIAYGSASTLEEAYATLNSWYISGIFYDFPRGWVFNGTGVALYLTAIEQT